MPEAQAVFGAVISPVDKRDYTLAVPATQLPKTHRLDWYTPVKDQGQTGSCVAHAAAALVEYYNQTQTGQFADVSPGYIYGRALIRMGRSVPGVSIRAALETLREEGVAMQAAFRTLAEPPEIINAVNRVSPSIRVLAKKNRISGYFSLSGMGQIKSAIYMGSPVVLAVDWYGGFAKARSVMARSGAIKYQHAMLAFGWDLKGLLVLNSHGATWGQLGVSSYPFSYPVREAWGATDFVAPGAVIRPKG